MVKNFPILAAIFLNDSRQSTYIGRVVTRLTRAVLASYIGPHHITDHVVSCQTASQRHLTSCSDIGVTTITIWPRLSMLPALPLVAGLAAVL